MYESEIIHESFRLGAAYKRQRHLESEEKYRDAKEKPPHGHGRILKNLVLHGSMTQSELAEILQIRPQSLTVAMQKLEEQGYVLRERDPKNRRQVLVSVTEEGKKHSGQLDTERESTAKKLLQVLSEEEKKQMYELLLRINKENRDA